MMTPTIWFTDKSLRFVTTSPSEGLCYDAVTEGPITRAKILNFFESTNSLAVLCTSPEEAFEQLKSEFLFVEAAGGVVCTSDGRLLMMQRNGRWDLPKGHWEEGESLEECALREVEEETGVRAERIVRSLGTTWHAYCLRGRWELKRTHWYEMSVSEPQPLTPQTEEGIVSVAWCSWEEVQTCLHSSYPTIRQVMRSLTE